MYETARPVGTSRRIQVKKLVRHPLFLLGLAVRLALIGAVAPMPVTEWYVPFMEASVNSFSLDPWQVWSDSGGTTLAFPYGYVMWLLMLPLMFLGEFAGMPLSYCYSGTLLIADIGMLLLLGNVFPEKKPLIMWAYWFSPIVIVANYVLGFNDLLPVLLLTVALYYVRKLHMFAGGLACTLAISAKLSMVMALPFFLIYLVRSRRLRKLLPHFGKGLLLGTILLLAPFFILSEAGTAMLFNNPEMGNIYSLRIDFGKPAIYIIPLIYALMFYSVWNVRRLNFDLFFTTLGLVFLVVVIFSPSSPGWYVWAVPFLVSYHASGERFVVLLGLFYALSNLLPLGTDVLHASFQASEGLVRLLDSRLPTLLNTGVAATGLILAFRVWVKEIRHNDYFRFSRKPFVVGIAGDSGAGKDRFADALRGLFGAHSVTMLTGDDYHLWDRHKPIWSVMTHLNPRANNLAGFFGDLVSLISGKDIRLGHYDHDSGHKGHARLVRSNDIIIVSGLHALYHPSMRNCYDLSIYLDTDEALRRFFKIKRDSGFRGHSEEEVLSSLERRESESQRFIRPQAGHADLVLSLHPANSRMKDMLLEDKSAPPQLILVAKSRTVRDELVMMRVLVGILGLHVDMLGGESPGEVEFRIDGEVSAPDIEMAAQLICPRLLEFLDIHPRWESGVTGLMQLIALSHIDQVLTEKSV